MNIRLKKRSRTGIVTFALLAIVCVVHLTCVSALAQSKTDAARAPIIDGHRHVGYGGFLGDKFRAEHLIEEINRLGIDKAVILPMGEIPDSAAKDTARLAEIEKANEDYFKRGIIGDAIREAQAKRVDHSDILDAVHRFPKRLFGVYIINPWLGKVELDAAEKMIRNDGFRGLKLHPMMHAFPADHEVVDSVLKFAGRLDVPVMFHSSFGLGTEPERVARVAARFPDVKIIMFHPGIGAFYKDAIKAAREHTNIYLDTAHADRDAIQAFLDQVPTERIIYGSDAPWGKWAEKFELVQEITKPQPDAQRLIMGQNVARIMKIQ